MPTADTDSGYKVEAPARWEEVRRLFGQAADLPPDERAELLSRLSVTDPDLRAELERLLAGDERADEVLEPFEAIEALADWSADALLGRVDGALGERYAIERVIGRGGMATVFEARDHKHDRSVAIKVLHRELASTVGAERFLQEIRVVAPLQHPHILPLHDSGEAGGFLYYVMPYVEGESMRERLDREGTLPEEDVLRIGRHVAAALEHAHAHGVIHRDIKPGNILLTGDHAVVADFGIAKAVSQARDEAEVTTPGLLVGTPAYMAPEQVRGEATARTDLYALGAVLYEALTGRRWALGTAVEAADWSGVGPKLRPLLGRALRPDPADRWADAGAFREALGEAVRGGLLWEIHRRSLWQVLVGFAVGAWVVLQLADTLASLLGLPLWFGQATIFVLAVCLPLLLLTAAVQAGGRRPAAAGVRTGVRRVLNWRNAALGGVGAFALLGVGTAGYMAMRSMGIGPAGTLIARQVLQEGVPLVLADFASAPEDSALARTVSAALRIDLSQSRAVTIAEPPQVRQILGQMTLPRDAPLDLETAREVALRGAMAGVLAGELRRAGDRIVLTARILSAEAGEVLVSRRETAASEQEILAAIDRLSAHVRERIGESLKQIRAAPPLEAVTTRSLPALRKYTEAWAVQVADFDPEYEVTLLEEAVALDPEFAMAWRRLAAAEWVSPARSLEALTKAFELRHRLTERERYLVMGTYYTRLRDRPRAIQAYRTLLKDYPDDPAGLDHLAYQYFGLRDYAAAETLFARITRLDPSRVSIERYFARNSWYMVAASQVAQGKIEEARATFERCAELYPDDTWVQGWWLSGGIAGTLIDYDTAETRARAVAEEGRWGPSTAAHTSIQHQLGGFAILRGRLDEAERIYNGIDAPPMEQRDPTSLFSMTVVLMEAWHRRNPEGALRIIQEMLRGYALDSLPVLDRPYAELASLYAAAGRPQLARAMLTAYEATIPLDPARAPPRSWPLSWVSVPPGDVAFAEGRYDRAIAEYRAADEAAGCRICVLGKLASAYDAAGQSDSAIAVYERYVTRPWIPRLIRDIWWMPIALERLGQLYDARGDRERAAHYHARFVELWKDADPELQPRVQAARQRLKEISGTRG